MVIPSMKNWKTDNAKILVIIGLCILGLVGSGACVQEGFAGQQKLRVGTMVAPPLAMKTADGHWEGLSIELLQRIAEEIDVEFTLIEFDNIIAIWDALKDKKVDVIPAVAITEYREAMADFSHAYIASGSAIAVSADTSGNRLFHFGRNLIDHIISLDLLLIILALILLSFAAGAMVWLFEGRHNREMFGGGPLKGLGHGIWWAMVTMTTVGYGDKAPKTPGGRTVALVWMVVSIILVASFTAAVTASLTVDRLDGKVRSMSDLYEARVGSVAESANQGLLAKRGIAVRSFANLPEGMQALVDNKIDALVFNELILRYIVKNKFPGRVYVLPETFDRYFGGIAMQPGSPLREPLNRALLKIIATDEWVQVTESYIGHGG